MSGVAYPFDWVDAFTDRPFGGNGCAVVHDGGGLPDEVCLNFTRETSLVECTFVGPSDVADVRVRYFLAEREIPFAGHPTIATVASLLDRGLVAPGAVRLETGAGVVPIEISDDDVPLITMTQNAPVFGPEVAPELVADVLSLDPEDIAAPPQVVSTGLPFCVTLLRYHYAIRRAKMNADALARFRAAISFGDTDVMEPYAVTLQGETEAGDTFSRLLLAPPNPPEDPFTGSATGCAASYLWARGLIETPHFIAEQGHWMGRPGQAQVQVLGTRDAITGVKVSGTGRIVMSGEFRAP